jgi:murein L,D-transpeptidase YcbB/YkuD
MRRSTWVVTLALAVLAPMGCARTQKPAPETVQSLKERLEAPKRPAFVSTDGRGARLWKTARRFYQRHGYEPAWMAGRRPRREAADLMAAVEAARADGLDPAEYDLQALSGLRTEKSRNPFKRDALKPEEVAETDLRLTYVFLALASDLLVGRVDPEEVDPHWFGQTRQADLAGILDGALDSGRIKETLADMAPRHAQYGALKQALQKHREIAAAGGWPTDVSASSARRTGTADAGTGSLEKRLAAGGDLSGQAPGVAEGLKRFQRRHGLPDTGKLDGATLAALNVPVERRIRQLELNLERWRWLPESFGERHIVVNVPTFTLSAVEGGKATLVMRVVAGEKENPTPIFSDSMTTIVFSPYWNIPAEIARKETIPAVMRDPGYLAKNNLEVVQGSRVVDPGSVDWSDDDPEFRIRQRPGARNSLGRVKFIFPNKFDVYLHDTPADELFARVQRDFSHGCVRVEKPEELAQWLLRGQSSWTPTRIQAAMHSGEEQHVALSQPVPVFIVYQTAWVEPDGTVVFAPDLYGHDARQMGIVIPEGAAEPPPARVARN